MQQNSKHRTKWLKIFGGIAVCMAAAELHATTSATDDQSFHGLPHMVCVDLRTSPICKDYAKKTGMMEALKASIPLNSKIPMIACDIPDAPGPCSSKECGDGICSFGERGSCQSDCPNPAVADLCECDENGCKVLRVNCSTTGCGSTEVPVEPALCTCSAPDGSQTCKSEPGAICQSLVLTQPLKACHLVRRQTTPTVRTQLCTDKTCADDGLSLRQVDALPEIKKTDVDGPR